ncbi:MAG: LptF/LptG family permease [Phycisphaerae bacterium]|nr:LptF/LptG family permease [Phycisphaerae bacterium]MBT5365551.1 LptF/LptG family permease [Phycisphaerae bacterium]MBT6283176.1 LptF/LptG family permease [Phycisphaerae bacterium]
MPWRFYRYMLTDVLRQFITTGLILVIVIAFGAAIKPLSSGNLISGWDTFRYLTLAMIPMLQFAIPFAGAFAVTISLHRMAQDNEFIAMSVSGQSYIRLLAPMVAFGLALTISVVILTQSIIPTFIGKMADAMSTDLPRLMTNSIKQHTPFVQGDLMIWAEDIYLDTNNDDERMALEQVAVARMSKDGRAKMYLTASAAIIDVQRVDNQTSMYVGTRNATQWTRGEGNAGILRGAREGRLTQAIELQSISKKRLSSLTLGELIKLRTQPAKYPKVENSISGLRSNIKRREFLDSLQEQFEVTNQIECVTVPGGRRFIIQANAILNGRFIPPITIESIRATGESSTLVPKSATFLVDQLETGEVEAVTLQLKDVIVGFGKVGENVRGELVIPSLQVVDVAIGKMDDSSYTELLAIADARDEKDVAKAATALRMSIISMNDNITGRIGQRWAVSIFPMLVILLGSLLAVRYPQVMPLGVYAKVFVPAVVGLLLIFSGGQMVRGGEYFSGFTLMWIGNIGLVVFIIFHWNRLRQT